MNTKLGIRKGKMPMKKVLYKREPHITSYPIYANVLSMLPINEYTDTWINTNFIQLFIRMNPLYPNGLSFYFPYFLERCPFIIMNNISRDFVKQELKNDMINFLKNTINEDKYVYFFAAESQLSLSTFFERESNYTHDIFVYGYDDASEVFYISGSFNNGKYINGTCTFAEMQRAHDHTDLSKDWLNGIRVFQYQPNDTIIAYLPHIEAQLNEYVKSENSAIKIGEYFCFTDIFGINVYHELVHIMDTMYTEHLQFEDVRYFTFLWEHKKSMVQRLEWLGQREFIHSESLEGYIQEYHLMEEMSKVHTSLFIKFLVNSDQAILKKLSVELKEIYNREKFILTELIRLIAGSSKDVS